MIFKILILFLIIFFPLSVFSEWRDPTRPEMDLKNPNVAPTTSLELNAIIIDHNTRKAVINAQIVHVGDMLSGQKVITIRENVVQLEGSSGKITLFLFDKPIKQIPSNNG